MSGKLQALEAAIVPLTKEINGQFPRPWMTDLLDPSSAAVFIVGKNQKNGFPAKLVGTHNHYIDTLFNRGGENSRQLYARLVTRESPTRQNTDKVQRILYAFGCRSVLQTNVICYSSHSSRALRDAAHSGGLPLGVKIFDTVLTTVRPKVVIAHGESTSEYLEIALGISLPRPPKVSGPLSPILHNETQYFVVPTLDPRHFPRWERWASSDYDGLTYLEGVCRSAASLVSNT